MVVMKVLSDIKKFLITPDDSKYSFESSGERIASFIKLFGINLLISFVILSALTGIIRLNLEIDFKPINISLFNLWLANLLLIPVLEEIAFRLSLRLTKIYLSLSVSAITYMVASYSFGIDIIDFNQKLLFRLAVAFIGFITAYLLLRNKKIFENVNKVWRSNFKLIYYFFLFLFVIRHIDMYELNLVTILFLPLLLSPQLISGIFLSFVRMRFGFGYSLIFHVMINLIAFSPQIISHVINNS